MEATKKVGAPDPSGPQGLSSAGSQQLGTPDDIQEHKVTRRQMLPEQSENLEENLLAGSCKATSGPEHSGTPKSQSTSCEGSSSQPDQQPLNGCNTYTNVPLSAYQAAYHRWPPIQSSVEVLQIPLSSAPTCQLREAMEDNVQVFDMATGNTRIELLCHDLMDSQAVLVGVLPNHPSIHIPENTQSLATPVDLADRPCSNFCSTPPVLSSPVPSSLSSGSYPEVALLPKEARLNLESQNSPDTETPIRVRMLTRPISQGMPLQFENPSPPKNPLPQKDHKSPGTLDSPPPFARKLSPWAYQLRVQEKQLSLITFTTPDSGCKVLPIAMVGTEPQGTQLKITAENITHSSVVAHIDLPHGTCDELMSTMDALPVQFPVICRHFLGPYQDMAAIVIDTGTGFTKCGLAAKDRVLSVVPSRVQLLQPSAQGQPQYIVPEDQEGTYPVLNRGVISDWDALEVLWQHLFCCRLGVQPEELAVLVADSPISPRTNREKVAEILFEHFHVPAMQAVHQALLALYAYGRTTGLVLGSGYGTSYAAPILTGDFSPLDTYRLDIGGCDLTEYLVQLLLAGGHSPPKTELVNHIKETSCYVTMDMVAEMACTQAQACVDFVLPDKQVITLGSERFHCPEALFQPNLLGLNQPGLPQLALESIRRLESKQQEQLLANVVLDGGSTLMNGFPERLRKELGPGATVLGSPHRAVAVWLGGSIMASRDAFQSLWLSRREYEEEGPWAIYKYHL
ncbi:uncharacterized protein ACDL77_018371 [Rhynchocyon petersi]